MLAMHDKTPRGVRLSALSLATIASMLAPTEGGGGGLYCCVWRTYKLRIS